MASNPFGISFVPFTRNAKGETVAYAVCDKWTLEPMGYVQRVDGVGPLWQGICLKPHPDGYTAVLDRTRFGAAQTVQDWHRGIYA